jgi:hypothetical protein
VEQNIPDEDTSYDRWRCGEHRRVKPKTPTTEANASPVYRFAAEPVDGIRDAVLYPLGTHAYRVLGEVRPA